MKISNIGNRLRVSTFATSFSKQSSRILSVSGAWSREDSTFDIRLHTTNMEMSVWFLLFWHQIHEVYGQLASCPNDWNKIKAKCIPGRLRLPHFRGMTSLLSNIQSSSFWAKHSALFHPEQSPHFVSFRASPFLPHVILSAGLSLRSRLRISFSTGEIMCIPETRFFVILTGWIARQTFSEWRIFLSALFHYVYCQVRIMANQARFIA